jgi:membrane-associated phospholipid phosphatase
LNSKNFKKAQVKRISMKKTIQVIIFSVLFGFQQKGFAQITDSLTQAITNKVEKKAEQEYVFSDGTVRTYYKPRFLEIITKVPRDFIQTNKDFIAKDHALYLGGSLASTLILIPVDQQIIDKSRAWSNNVGLSPDNTYGKFGPLENIPQNIGAGFYLIGNGTTVILLATGFTTFGLLKDDYRAKATASGLMESLILSGVFAQTIKRITGRESPYIAIPNGNPGGDWNPFPSFSAYAKQTPHYDAMPSGHLITIMSALTVITTNYPDYKWIKPIGYTLIAGMCFQMIQSQVHWASDYPLAIFMGYFIGKTIAKNRYTETQKVGQANKKYKIDFSASRQYGFNTIGATIKF